VAEKTLTGTSDRGGDRISPAAVLALRAEKTAAALGRVLGFERPTYLGRRQPRAPDRRAKLSGPLPVAKSRRLKAVDETRDERFNRIAEEA
jgi:hypothetical protein